MNLGVGVRGKDVQALMQALGKSGGPQAYSIDERGSVEEILYSEAVAAAVSSFQEKYKSEILTPTGLQNATGYVGVATRAKLNKLYGCGVGSMPIQRSSVKVISPNGGEAWKVGENYQLVWSQYIAQGDKNHGKQITFRRFDKVTGKELLPIFFNLPGEGTADATSVGWTPTIGVTADGIVKLDDPNIMYKMHVELTTRVFEMGTPNFVSDDSDTAFTITSQ